MSASTPNSSGPRSSLLAFGVLLLLAGAGLVPFIPVGALIASLAAAICAAVALFKSDDLVWKAISAGLLAGAVVLAYFGIVAVVTDPGEVVTLMELEEIPPADTAPEKEQDSNRLV